MKDSIYLVADVMLPLLDGGYTSCGDGAQRVAAGFKAAGGAKRAVGILEALLN